MELNLIGQALGKYHILEEIGRGGMGVVYKAHDTMLDRPVAIKVLAPHLTWDREFVQRFLQEARAAAGLKHPNIVTIYDVGQVQGYHFIAMEYLEGCSLAEIIRREGWLPMERAVHILGQIARSLDYAHARGLIHRDVKPGNVIVSPHDHATLTDFGVAKALAGTRLTRTGTMLGTPSYMAPEQVKGQPVGPATDVYALGVVAYEMLGGRPPFQGDTPRVLHAHVYEEPPPLPQANPRIPPAIWVVVQKALAKEPGKRYRSARAFTVALGEAVGLGERAGIQKPAPRSSQVPLWLLFGALAAVLLVVVLVIGIGVGRFGRGPAALVPSATVSKDTVAVIATQSPVTSTPAEPPTNTPTATHMPTSTVMRTLTLTPTATPVPPTATRLPHTPTPLVIINLTTAVQVSTSDQAKDAVDTCGNTVFYFPENLIDGRRETAWRVEGHGQGAWVQFDFGSEVMLSSVQILPGYSKRDPCDKSIDWCPKNRIPQRVRLQTSAGEWMELALGNECIWQAFDIGPWRITSLQVTILSSYPRREEHHTDYTAISEIRLLGWEF